MAGNQTFRLGVGYSLTNVKVNGSAATTTTSNRVVTISSPTLAGGETVVVTETFTPPSVPVAAPMPAIGNGVSVTLARTQNGVSANQVLAGLPDVKGTDPEFNVTGTTKTNS